MINVKRDHASRPGHERYQIKALTFDSGLLRFPHRIGNRNHFPAVIFGRTSCSDNFAPRGDGRKDRAWAGIKGRNGSISNLHIQTTNAGGTGPFLNSARVSIIIPAYRAANFLDRAIASAAGQTEPNLEVIVVDDCSPDQTWDIASAWSARDKRIRAYRLSRNRGKSYIMNWATNQAVGKWIAVLDADDWYHETRIMRLLDIADREGVEFVGDNLVYVDEKAATFVGTAFPERGLREILDLDRFLVKSDPTKSYDPGMLQPIVLREFVLRHEIKYYEAARIGEDFYFLLTLLAEGARGIVVDEPLYYYVQPYGTVSRKPSHADRRPYSYSQMLQVHDHFSDLLRHRLSPMQVERLNTRRRGIVTMIHFQSALQNIADREWGNALSSVMSAPNEIWPLILRRGGSRLFGPVFGLRMHSPMRQHCAGDERNETN